MTASPKMVTRRETGYGPNPPAGVESATGVGNLRRRRCRRETSKRTAACLPPPGSQRRVTETSMSVERTELVLLLWRVGPALRTLSPSCSKDSRTGHGNRPLIADAKGYGEVEGGRDDRWQQNKQAKKENEDNEENEDSSCNEGTQSTVCSHKIVHISKYTNSFPQNCVVTNRRHSVIILLG